MHRMRIRAVRSVLFGGLSLVLAFGFMTGCNNRDQVRTTTKNAVEATGTVQADGVSSAPATATADGGVPQRVLDFAKDAKYPVWYPTYMPAGFKIETVDLVEFEPDAGPVADVLLLNVDKAVNFTQGAPAGRVYETKGAPTTPWGDETAYVLIEDAGDPASTTIVIAKDGTLAELRGDIPLAELKKIAASMEVVK